MKTILIPAIILLAIIFSCNKTQVSPVDPCANEKPFKANFYIQESVGDSLVKTDKVMQYGTAVFNASSVYDTYEWKIGNDDRTFKTKKVSLLFKDSIKEVSVRLIATKKPNACFPNDKTIDTVYKSFSVIPWREWPLRGTYIGSFDSDKSKNDSVKLVFIPTPDGWGDFQIININCGCNLDSSISWIGNRGSMAFTFKEICTFYAGCKGPSAWVQLKGLDTLIVDFTYKERTLGNPNDANSWPLLRDKFIGIRKK